MRHHLGQVRLYVATMGKVLAVTSAFTTDEAANAHCAKTEDAVVAVTKDGLILCAQKWDAGVKFLPRDYPHILEIDAARCETENH